jgi:hypothetical protein
MAGLRLAACAVLLCLLISPTAALRWLSDPAPETAAAGHDSFRTAYHFQPAENWQNGRISSRFLDSLRQTVRIIHSFGWLTWIFSSVCIHRSRLDSWRPPHVGADQIQMVRTRDSL